MDTIKSRLSLMMFLQYAVWGVWLPVLATYLQSSVADGGMGFTSGQVGLIIGVAGSVGAVSAPFIAGQFADRYFATEKFLAALLVLGGIVKISLSYQDSFAAWLVLATLYSVLYMPTLSLTNSMAFAHLDKAESDFPRVRVWGTIGWIAASWLFPMIWLQSNLEFQVLPPFFVGNEVPDARQAWAVDQLLLAAKASQNLGLTAHASFPGALAWPYLYPWPQRPAGLVEAAFDELAKRWLPILDAFDDAGVDIGFEIHPGEDLHDGVTFEMFLERVNNHPRCNILFDPSHLILQQLDYLGFMDAYKDRIKLAHIKDAEFNPTAKQGVYGGYQSWIDRAGRFRSLGDGQVDFNGIFSKLAANDFDGWAVLEWECCLKHPEDGAREGAIFIRDHIIRVTDKAFDDFADAGTDDQTNRNILGLS